MCEFGRVDFSNVFQLCLSFMTSFLVRQVSCVFFKKVSLGKDYHFTLSTYCNFGIFYWKKNSLCPLKSKYKNVCLRSNQMQKSNLHFHRFFSATKKVLLHSLRNTKSISSLKIKLSVNKRTISNKRKQKDLESLSYSFLAFLPI